MQDPELRALLVEERRRKIRRSLTAWCTEALAPLGQKPAAHHLLLIRELEALAAGRIDRLAVFMPPGSAKSTYVSALFPAWWFAAHPRSSVIATSHTTAFARRWGRRVRNLVLEHSATLGYGLAPDETAADRWSTDAGGEYGAFGLGAAVTGRRADLVVIDDPVSGQDKADSPVERDNAWDWYRFDLLTRLKPGGRVALVMTRWHEDDLAGRALAEDAGWHVLSLPAIAGDADPMGRAAGDPLWPSWEDAAALARKRAQVGERAWWALYQQSPRPLSGGLFRVEKIGTLDAAPAGGRLVRAWDLAATDQVGSRDPDWTVGIKLARYDDSRFVVLDAVRLRGGPDEVEAAIVNTAAADGRAVPISLPQDPGQAGKAQVLYLTRKLAGYRVESSPETGDKSTRAAPVASQVNVGNLSFVRAPWNSTLRDELAGFPAASKDDQVDALSRAFAALIAPPEPARRQQVHLLGR